MFDTFTDLETELFQLIVTRKAQGKTWGEIAQEVPLTVRELERLPWTFPHEWDRDFARAEKLHRHDLLAPCINKVQAALLAANEPQHLGILSRAITTLLKSSAPTRITERGTRKSEWPDEDEDEQQETGEGKTQSPNEEVEEVTTPEQKRVEQIAELLEKEEERIFNEQLQKKLSGLPDVIERIQELAKQHADHAPVLEQVEPEPTPPAPTVTNPSTVKKAAGWAALIFVLFFLCRGVSRAALSEHREAQKKYNSVIVGKTDTQFAPIWPLSGDD